VEASGSAHFLAGVVEAGLGWSGSAATAASKASISTSPEEGGGGGAEAVGEEAHFFAGVEEGFGGGGAEEEGEGVGAEVVEASKGSAHFLGVGLPTRAIKASRSSVSPLGAEEVEGGGIIGAGEEEADDDTERPCTGPHFLTVLKTGAGGASAETKVGGGGAGPVCTVAHFLGAN
jgi:hypothetical protein